MIHPVESMTQNLKILKFFLRLTTTYTIPKIINQINNSKRFNLAINNKKKKKYLKKHHQP